MSPNREESVPMKHTEPNFYKYVNAYILLGAGTILLLDEIADWGIMGKRPMLLLSFFAIWMGVVTLINLKKSTSQPAG
ncbi:MAG: hypothetical protein ACK49R_02065 [Planctomycetota bacterium]